MLSPAKMVPTYKQLDEPENVDMKENLCKTLTRFTNGASVDANQEPIDLQSATLTTRPLRSAIVS